jgi:hypothetical protein
MVFIPLVGISQTFDHNLFEQGALDTLVADSTSMTSDTIWFSSGQKGGFTIRGHSTKLTGDDKTLTVKAILFFDENDPTDISDEKILGTKAVTTTQINYSYSLPNYTFWGVARGVAIIYEIPSGGTMPSIEIKGKALTR